MEKILWLSTMRTGLEKSRNLMTVRIAQDLGLDKITKFSKNLVFMKIQMNYYQYH